MCLNLWFSKLVHACKPLKPSSKTPGIHVTSIQIQKLARLPDLFENPELHIKEIRTMYQDMRADHPRLRCLVTSLGVKIGSGCIQNDPTYVSDRRIFHRVQVVYGILLTFIISLNSLLRTLDPDDLVLLEDSYNTANDILVLAQQASQYRPLGAGYIPPCLAAVVGDH
jgi:hypothetical protein